MLLAFDLDKTIVTNEYQLPIEIIDALGRARKAGHEVTILTGRPFINAAPVVEQLKLSAPHSVNHGAQVVDAAGQEIRRVQMTGAEADAILKDHIDVENLDFSVMLDEQLHVKDPNSPSWDFVHTEKRLIEQYRPGNLHTVDKVVFYGPDHTDRLTTVFEKTFPRMERYLWANGYLEVVPERADKGSALAFIAEKLGYEQQDVVAFGDGSNDVSMIGWAGHGVAVGPWAVEGVLNNAQEHIASPEELGVAAWIEKNLGV